ncbi:integral membrane sensor signal transduction histidine kinase [Chthoniobacter flavus Ellin428]|uniref:histidine kinase n=1 Tax=Chthoniobacter flavus Ellin428 TaxID=497964 RepID=B4D1X0_9BACT|nr:sensor histidine kinase [Chthoniobacter flavus]EDY19732.1 integral membrane sensor signal transduction histidine kinase [Chthoniobacter flavus Ellin428]TCO92967.1 HAMP domain-containing protein [Chthoniobacter flavus]
MKARRVTILRKGLLVLALPLVYQALFIGLLLKRQNDLSHAQHWAMHTKDVIEETEYIFRMLVATQSNLRGYLLTGKDTFPAEIARDDGVLDAAFTELKVMIQDNPEQQVRFQQILESAQARRDYQHKVLQMIRKDGMAGALDEIKGLKGKQLMDDLRTSIENFRAAEEKLDTARLDALNQSTTTQNWLLIGGLALNVGIGAVAAMMFSREIASRIEVVTQNTRRITNGETLPSLVPGSDEIRELDEQFHLLADHLRSAKQRERVYQEALERRAADLTRANRDLEQKNQEIEMFVYSVSHDLRSPLVNLQGFSNELALAREELQTLLKDDLSAEDRRRATLLAERDMTESVHYIQTAVTRLSSIIDALLRLSRAGRVEYHPKMVELKPVIQRIVEAMRGTIDQHEAEVAVLDLPAVWGDPTALEQIFANLIGNAINYLSPERPGRIEIGSVTREAEGVDKPLTYYVKDNGLGIAEKYLGKVFAIFQRLHGDVAKGEGVGLALVRRVVERHGGKVWVESTEGVGSTFFVAFPSDPRHSPLPGVAPRKERINVSIPQHDHTTSHYFAR